MHTVQGENLVLQANRGHSAAPLPPLLFLSQYMTWILHCSLALYVLIKLFKYLTKPCFLFVLILTMTIILARNYLEGPWAISLTYLDYWIPVSWCDFFNSRSYKWERSSKGFGPIEFNRSIWQNAIQKLFLTYVENKMMFFFIIFILF